MITKHAEVLARIGMDKPLAKELRAYFDLPKRRVLVASLHEKGLGQADLVLFLLRVGTATARRHVEALVGKPILIGPPCLLIYRTNGKPTVVGSEVPDDRKILWVCPTNPRLTNTEAHLRWKIFRVGRSIAQVKARGATKRDVRRAIRKGWIRVEGAKQHAV